jgi:hypothetical protein
MKITILVSGTVDVYFDDRNEPEKRLLAVGDVLDGVVINEENDNFIDFLLKDSGVIFGLNKSAIDWVSALRDDKLNKLGI